MCRILVPFGLALSLAPASAQESIDPALLTVAEKSDFRATSRYADVVALCERLAAASPLVKLSSLGKSGEGRDLPLLLIADPPVSTPEDAKRNDRLLIFIIANIHSGECDGKEAMLTLAREIEAASKRSAPHPLLKDLILAIAPIYNADGNERVSKNNRPGQVGPEEGMGQRENAAGLDLNRDYIKLEASETRGLVDFLNRWDPAVFVDCHTTNGCYHRYVITYEGPKAPAGDMHLLRFCRDEMMPAISRECESKYAVPSFVYGDFNRDHTKWETYPAQARYGTTYVGLRNRISILVESYSYAPYKTRILGSRDYVKACLEHIAANKTQIHKMLADADGQSEPPPPKTGLGLDEGTDGRTQTDPAKPAIALRIKAVAAPTKVSAHGFIEEQRDGKTVSTGVPKDYDVELWTHFEPTLTIEPPDAYLFPADLKDVIQKLRQHGIRTETLSNERELPIRIYRLDKVVFADKPFQKHKTATVEVTPRAETRRFPAGTIVIPTAQKLGRLAAYLLEPQCEDGLLTWNFFDDKLKIGDDFPVVRLEKSATLPGKP